MKFSSIARRIANRRYSTHLDVKSLGNDWIINGKKILRSLIESCETWDDLSQIFDRSFIHEIYRGIVNDLNKAPKATDAAAWLDQAVSGSFTGSLTKKKSVAIANTTGRGYDANSWAMDRVNIQNIVGTGKIWQFYGSEGEIGFMNEPVVDGDELEVTVTRHGQIEETWDWVYDESIPLRDHILSGLGDVTEFNNLDEWEKYAKQHGFIP